jgi:hypothetical protein
MGTTSWWLICVGLKQEVRSGIVLLIKRKFADGCTLLMCQHGWKIHIKQMATTNCHIVR